MNAQPQDGGERAVVRIGKAELAFALLFLLVWLFGVSEFDALLSIDTQCEETRYYGRGAEIAEILRCSIEAGPRGWLYLGWFASFPLAVTIWLERKLRRYVLNRGAKGRRG